MVASIYHNETNSMIIKNTYSTLSVIIIMSLLYGCAGQSVKLTPQDRAQLIKLQGIKTYHQNAGWPTLKTPMGVLASDLTLGLSDDWSAGQKLVNKFNIPDPGQRVKQNFLKQINAGTKAANFVNVKQALTHDEGTTEALKAKYGKGVVLKFSSHIWQIWYYPFNWARYHMWYGSTAELIRLNDSRVLWSATCRADQDNKDTAPTLDELTADNSTVFKRWVEAAADTCAKQFVYEFLQ